MAFALFRTESDQRINVPIRTNTQRFCLVRTVRYQAKGLFITPEPDKSQRIYRIQALDAHSSHLKELICLDYIRAPRWRAYEIGCI
jgi:hypothetical protein